MQPNQNPTCNVTENFPQKKNYFKILRNFSPKNEFVKDWGGQFAKLKFWLILFWIGLFVERREPTNQP